MKKGSKGRVKPNPQRKAAKRSRGANIRGAPSADAKVSFPVVGIGASAGGLEAFSELLTSLPQRTGVAFVLVQHLDPAHESVLPEILARTTDLPVTQVTNGVAVEPDHVYVIPANTNMSISGGELRLAARTLIRGQHLPIDHFLNSLAADVGNRAIGVILSGTASDGTEGCLAIKEAGGITFAQDETSAKYTSMPRSAINAGCIDFVLPPAKIAKELSHISRHPYFKHPIVREEEKETPALGSDGEMEELFSMLHAATGVNFAQYKQTTLQRRIKRRLVLHRFERLKNYLKFIHENPKELEELYRDILIHVTGFFRDPEAFEALRREVFPHFFENRKPGDGPIRIWVPGCSTGEEVYSIAMCLLEFMWKEARGGVSPVMTKEVQIFATDISETALDRARSGHYTEGALSEVSPERIKRFFTKLDGGYQIIKPVRDMCVFARQNVASDPPFSNIDLISCRNLLIYLGTALQKRVIPTLHYALKPNGYLILGESESLGAFGDHFTLLNKRYKIYLKKRTAERMIGYMPAAEYMLRGREASKAQKLTLPILTVEKEVDRVLANRYIPASIVVNDDMEILQFRGRTGAYLEPAAGHPTFSLSKMAREGLLVDLRAAISEAKRTGEVARRERVEVKNNGGPAHEVNLEVIPLTPQTPKDRLYVVAFQDAPAPKSEPVSRSARGKSKADAGLIRDRQRLESELLQLREELKSLIEEHEMTSEEFKSANEEVLSANEELQSTNEELETAKEELQSSNEELTTLNEELQNRNSELTVANNDLINLLGTVNIPVVMVGNDLRVRRFTTPAQKLLNLIPADVGRRLGEIRPNIEMDDFEQVVQDTVDTATLHERELRDHNGVWYAMRVRPYKTWDNKIDGAVITFLDIDAIKRSLEQTRTIANIIIENAKEPILLLDPALRVMVANRAFYERFQETPGATERQFIYDLGNGQWNIPRLRELLQLVNSKDGVVDDFEVRQDFPQIGPKVMLLNARRIESQGQRIIFLSIRDVSDLRGEMQSLRRQAALLQLAHETVLVRDLEGKIQFWNRGAERMYGWTAEEAIGKNTHDLLKTQFPVPFDEIRAELERSGHWEGELVHTTKSGEHRTVRSRWVIERADDVPAVVLEINSDISDLRRSEESLRHLSGYLMRLQDEERRRIARELHDSTGQKLVALKMNLDPLSRQKDLPAKDKKVLTETVKLADEATNEIRTLAQLLHPPMLDEAGLVSATRWLVERFSSRSGIKVDLQVSSDLGRLPEPAELALFRVIQEALNNIHRHSGAGTARIALTRSDNHVELKVSDDGKGLPDKVLTSGDEMLGVGILGMRERLSQLGGTLEINSTPKGAAITATVPVTERKEA